MRKQILITLVSVVVGIGLLSAQARETLDVYVVDTEGGNATLFVTPSGGSVLIGRWQRRRKRRTRRRTHHGSCAGCRVDAD